MKLLLVLSVLLQTLQVSLAQGECPLGNAIALQLDGSVTFRHVTNPEESTITLQLAYEGEGWLGIGPSINGRMIGAQAVIGLPDQAVGVNNPVVYNLGGKSVNSVQPLNQASQLQDADILQNETHTVLTYTMPLNAGDVPLTATGRHTFLWAVGFSNSLDSNTHRRRGDFALDLVPCGGDAAGGQQGDLPVFLGVSGGGAPNQGLWKAHGILMAIAWAILVPLAVGASRLRCFFSSSPGLWIKIHLACTLTAVLCVLVSFIIAVVTVSDQVAEGEDAQHFTANKHRKVGLVVTLLMVVQVVVAAVRPHPPVAPSPKDVDVASSTPSTSQQDSRHDKADTNDESADEEADTEVEQPSKSWLRVVWEVKHRLFGITLVALSWYNCDLGIDRYVVLYGEGGNASGAFWGVAGSIVGALFILNVAQRIRESKKSD